MFQVLAPGICATRWLNPVNGNLPGTRELTVSGGGTFTSTFAWPDLQCDHRGRIGLVFVSNETW
jgi:hypothetical protein